MDSIAFAMGPSGAPQQGGAAFAGFIPLIIIFAIFYFLLIRPQQKQLKAHREMLDALKLGDHIVTSGGLHGTVTGLTEKIITVEIAKDIKVKIERSSIAEIRKD